MPVSLSKFGLCLVYILACSQVTVPTSLRALPSGGCSLKHKLSESLLGSLKYLGRENCLGVFRY